MRVAEPPAPAVELPAESSKTPPSEPSDDPDVSSMLPPTPDDALPDVTVNDAPPADVLSDDPTLRLMSPAPLPAAPAESPVERLREPLLPLVASPLLITKAPEDELSALLKVLDPDDDAASLLDPDAMVMLPPSPVLPMPPDMVMEPPFTDPDPASTVTEPPLA